MYRYALNLKSLALQGQYLSSNEAMTDFGVVVDKVRDLQEMPHIYSMSYDCTRRSIKDELHLTAHSEKFEFRTAIDSASIGRLGPACDNHHTMASNFFC